MQRSMQHMCGAAWWWVGTLNKERDEGMEAMTSPYININTGEHACV